MGGSDDVGTLRTPTLNAALWVGFAAMTGFSALFLKASYSSRSKTNRVYEYITFLVTAIAMCAYLHMATGTTIDFGNPRYLDYALSTPLLVLDLGFLSGMAVPEVAFNCIVDLLMIVCGWSGHVSTDPKQTWAMFVLGASFFAIVVASLVKRMLLLAKREAASGIYTSDAKAYRFLTVWTLSLWVMYPVVFVLHETHGVSEEVITIIDVVLDIMSKGVFGALLVGSREALEGENTPAALLAMAVMGMDPSKRRASMVEVETPAIYAASRGSVELTTKHSAASDLDDAVHSAHLQQSPAMTHEGSGHSVASTDRAAIALLGSPSASPSKLVGAFVQLPGSTGVDDHVGVAVMPAAKGRASRGGSVEGGSKIAARNGSGATLATIASTSRSTASSRHRGSRHAALVAPSPALPRIEDSAHQETGSGSSSSAESARLARDRGRVSSSQFDPEDDDSESVQVQRHARDDAEDDVYGVDDPSTDERAAAAVRKNERRTSTKATGAGAKPSQSKRTVKASSKRSHPVTNGAAPMADIIDLVRTLSALTSTIQQQQHDIHALAARSSVSAAAHTRNPVDASNGSNLEPHAPQSSPHDGVHASTADDELVRSAMAELGTAH